MPAQLGANHDEIVRQAFQPRSGRTERLVINGLPATQFTGVRANAQGQPEQLLVTVVSGPGNNRFVLVWSARDAAALQRSRSQLQQAQDSFRALTVADRAAARPWVLRTVAYPAGGFAEMARRSPLDNPQAHLRLLNGVYGGGEPRLGQRVKVVESLP